MLTDLRYAVRGLRKNPVFTTVAVITLALGIGANTAIFTVVNAVLLRRLPYQDPGRLMMVFGTDVKRNTSNDVISYPTYLDWKAQNHSFAAMEAWAGWSFNLSGGDQPEQVYALRITPGLFSLLGVKPALGRGFLSEEQQVLAIDRNQPVARVKTLESLMADSIKPQRFRLLLIGIFAALALALATAGIYGVLSYTAGQRTHEIGVRAAMGARAADVMKLVLTQALRLVAADVVLRLAGALALTHVLERFLYGVKPGDPLILIAVSFLLVAVAVAASYVPARRAYRVDPVEALRYE